MAERRAETLCTGAAVFLWDGERGGSLGGKFFNGYGNFGTWRKDILELREEEL